MVVATHDVEFIRLAAIEIVFLVAGRVIEIGPPAQVITAPKTDRARRFFHPSTGPTCPFGLAPRKTERLVAGTPQRIHRSPRLQH